MKDLKHLNDKLEPGTDADHGLSMKDMQVWSLCDIPVMCLWDGQMPTVTLQDVILHNFLPNSVIGFLVTEKFDGIKPVVADDDIDDFLASVEKLKQVKAKQLAEDDEHLEEVCENCLHVKVSLGLPPCDGCFGSDNWEPQEIDCDKMISDGICPGCDIMEGKCPDLCDDPPEVKAESLYHQGCWATLENRLHDLMSEWSVLANGCKYNSTSTGCTLAGNQFCDCSWAKCPRVKS
jgi:hypothetical protein